MLSAIFFFVLAALVPRFADAVSMHDAVVLKLETNASLVAGSEWADLHKHFNFCNTLGYFDGKCKRMCKLQSELDDLAQNVSWYEPRVKGWKQNIQGQLHTLKNRKDAFLEPWDCSVDQATHLTDYKDRCGCVETPTWYSPAEGLQPEQCEAICDTKDPTCRWVEYHGSSEEATNIVKPQNPNAFRQSNAELKCKGSSKTLKQLREGDLGLGFSFFGGRYFTSTDYGVNKAACEERCLSTAGCTHYSEYYFGYLGTYEWSSSSVSGTIELATDFLLEHNGINELGQNVPMDTARELPADAGNEQKHRWQCLLFTGDCADGVRDHEDEWVRMSHQLQRAHDSTFSIDPATNVTSFGKGALGHDWMVGVVPASGSESWLQSNQMCKDAGWGSLCNRAQVCAGGRGGQVARGVKSEEGHAWMPIGDKSNDYVQVGLGDWPTCDRHTEIANGKHGTPGWGRTTHYESYKSKNICCSKTDNLASGFLETESLTAEALASEDVAHEQGFERWGLERFRGNINKDDYTFSYEYQGCKTAGHWVRPFGNVALTAEGAESCLGMCEAGGYEYGGFECPMSKGNQVHCQCAHAGNFGYTNDTQCSGGQQSRGHCNGAPKVGPFSMGAHSRGSVYRLDRTAPPIDSSSNFVVMSGAEFCQITNGGRCVTDGTGPSNYGNNEHCVVKATKSLTLTSEEFNTEAKYDKLTIKGVAYHGTSGPNSISMAAGDTMDWSSDSSINSTGFTVCVAESLKERNLREMQETVHVYKVRKTCTFWSDQNTCSQPLASCSSGASMPYGVKGYCTPWGGQGGDLCKEQPSSELCTGVNAVDSGYYLKRCANDLPCVEFVCGLNEACAGFTQRARDGRFKLKSKITGTSTDFGYRCFKMTRFSQGRINLSVHQYKRTWSGVDDDTRVGLGPTGGPGATYAMDYKKPQCLPEMYQHRAWGPTLTGYKGPLTGYWQFAQVRSIEQLASELKYFQTELRVVGFKLRDIEGRLENNSCQKMITAIATVAKVIYGSLCEIVAVLFGAAASVIDGVLGVLSGGTLLAMQSNPMCAGGWVANLKLDKSGLITGAKQILSVVAPGIKQGFCAMGKDKGIGNYVRESPEGNNFDFDDCSVVHITNMMLMFGINVFCGKFVSAMLTLVLPMIMCNLPLRLDGGMCQVDGCYDIKRVGLD